MAAAARYVPDWRCPVSKRHERPTRRTHLMLFVEDLEYLDRAFGAGSASRQGIGWAIRQIVHNKCVALQAREHALRDGRAGEGHPRGEGHTQGEASE